jgi:hypothetical protein
MEPGFLRALFFTLRPLALGRRNRFFRPSVEIGNVCDFRPNGLGPLGLSAENLVAELAVLENLGQTLRATAMCLPHRGTYDRDTLFPIMEDYIAWLFGCAVCVRPQEDQRRLRERARSKKTSAGWSP